MKAKFGWASIGVGLMVLAVLSLGCSKKSTGGGGSGFVSTPNISIQNLRFSPQRDSVAVGTIVTWTNNDNPGTNHTVTSISGTELNSPIIPSGDTYVDTMNTPGTFNYRCNVHPSMTGIIKVQ